MAWMADGGPEGYQEGKGPLPHEGSAIRNTRIIPEVSKEDRVSIETTRYDPLKYMNTESVKRDKPEDYMDPKNEVKNARYYQEITFRKLNDLMTEAAKRGNSRLPLTDISFGSSMIEYLKSKGINHSRAGVWEILSW